MVGAFIEDIPSHTLTYPAGCMAGQLSIPSIAQRIVVIRLTQRYVSGGDEELAEFRGIMESHGQVDLLIAQDVVGMIARISEELEIWG